MFDVTAKEHTAALPMPAIDVDVIKSKFNSIDHIDISLLAYGISAVIIYIRCKEKETIKTIANNIGATSGLKTVLFVDSDLPVDDLSAALWYSAGNIDPATDCFVIDNATGGCLCADATAKTIEADGFTRQWPSAVVMDSKTVAEVDKMQNDIYGIVIPSPSQRFNKLFGGEAVRYEN